MDAADSSIESGDGVGSEGRQSELGGVKLLGEPKLPPK